MRTGRLPTSQILIYDLGGCIDSPPALLGRLDCSAGVKFTADSIGAGFQYQF